MTEKLITLSALEMRRRIYRRQYHSDDTRSDYAYYLDLWYFGLYQAPSLKNNEALPIERVKKKVNSLLKQQFRLAYWSGGFDLGWHHNTIYNLRFDLPQDVLVVMGVEPDSYIQRKDRSPQFPQIDRISANGMMLKKSGKLGLIFPIPERSDAQDAEQFYSQLVTGIGMMRRPGCYHLYTSEDPHKESKIARMIAPEDWCSLRLIRDLQGRLFSTTRLLGNV